MWLQSRTKCRLRLRSELFRRAQRLRRPSRAVGRNDAAVAEAKRARELDPLSAQTTAFLGFILYQVRKYDEAIKELQTALEFDRITPEPTGGLRWLTNKRAGFQMQSQNCKTQWRRLEEDRCLWAR